MLDNPSYLFRKPPTKALLQSLLEEFMTWHASLLCWLLKKKNHPSTIKAQKLSALDEKEWQAERRRLKDKAHKQLKEGERLDALRFKVNQNDMSATEQQILQDFDSGKLTKQYEELRIQKLSGFATELTMH